MLKPPNTIWTRKIRIIRTSTLPTIILHHNPNRLPDLSILHLRIHDCSLAISITGALLIRLKIDPRVIHARLKFLWWKLHVRLAAELETSVVALPDTGDGWAAAVFAVCGSRIGGESGFGTNAAGEEPWCNLPEEGFDCESRDAEYADVDPDCAPDVDIVGVPGDILAADYVDDADYSDESGDDDKDTHGEDSDQTDFLLPRDSKNGWEFSVMTYN